MQALHRVRAQWHKTRRQRISLVRGRLTEFGLTSAKGTTQLNQRLRQHTEQIPDALRQSLLPILDEITALEAKIKEIDRQLTRLGKQHAVVQRLLTIPGVPSRAR